jgi:hypothetical protein
VSPEMKVIEMKDLTSHEMVNSWKGITFKTMAEFYVALEKLNKAFAETFNEEPYIIVSEKAQKYARIRCKGQGCKVRVEFNREIIDNQPANFKLFKNVGFTHNPGSHKA